MNGRDGQPFRTRDGGVMRLESLLNEVTEAVKERMDTGRGLSEDEADDAAEKIGLAAVKYGDLSNQATKDYIFDIERFTSFEGNTGPYIQYTIVRIGSILKKAAGEGCANADASLNGIVDAQALLAPATDGERALQLKLTEFQQAVDTAAEEIAPHRICQFVYELSDAFNSFYHQTKILSEEDPDRKASYIALIALTRNTLSAGIGLLGFSAPERM